MVLWQLLDILVDAYPIGATTLVGVAPAPRGEMLMIQDLAKWIAGVCRAHDEDRDGRREWGACQWLQCMALHLPQRGSTPLPGAEELRCILPSDMGMASGQ